MPDASDRPAPAPPASTPACPRCGCPTLTMLDRRIVLADGAQRLEWSCDACGSGWTERVASVTAGEPRDVAGFVGGGEH